MTNPLGKGEEAKMEAGSGYALIQDNSGDVEEPFLQDGNISRRSNYGTFIRSPAWAVTTLILTLIMVAENVYLLRTLESSKRNSTYETGFDTELEEMKPSIKLHQKRYTGAIRDLPNGTLYMAFNSSEPRYVGPPSPEIDDAWQNLLKGRYIHFTNDETAWLNTDRDTPTGTLEQLPSHGHSISTTGYYGGPDMLHSLHCINAIRQHIGMDYYHDEHVAWLPEEYRRMHIDHCIEQLRQATLCHGDMTPVTLKAIWTNTPRWVALGQTERLHTCRDGMALREATWERGEEVGRISFGL
ncbi:conserved hypothetical protein [Talaromyces stipitatus ATCC 10500]|uniref:Tat pathway signal sequence n=1 Tax=Talaromyces stipitatus (strain ATCC 10500 / CBS 375.48 / QM 6759 / NRRL 1006) TaxID=441959 RepID=B8MA85_TALSN|nr:uncharacterized protein TSTA_123160 [Talaromyces stipitatus ATCC 10500]EED18587.1 conserved hypothetical protein [Talaromyces stipitatus ATCC 10500]